MVSTSFLHRLSLVLCLATVSAFAQKPATLKVATKAAVAPVPVQEPVARGAADGAIITRKDARAITLKIPAPRGQIVDR